MSVDDTLGSPTLAFEKAHGLSGIAGRYAFPSEVGMDRLSLLQRIWSSSGMNNVPQEEMTRIFNELKKANPEAINKIAFDHSVPKQANDVVCGMVSGFNVDDINLFMKRAHENLPSTEWEGLLNDVKAWEIKIMQRLKLKPSIEWIASEPTLQNIWQQVKDKPILHSLEVSGGAANANASKWLIGAGIVAAAVGGYVVGQWASSRKKQDGYIAAHSNEKSAASNHHSL